MVFEISMVHIYVSSAKKSYEDTLNDKRVKHEYIRTHTHTHIYRRARAYIYLCYLYIYAIALNRKTEREEGGISKEFRAIFRKRFRKIFRSRYKVYNKPLNKILTDNKLQ